MFDQDFAETIRLSETAELVNISQTTPADELVLKIGGGLMIALIFGSMVMVVVFKLLPDHVFLSVVVFLLSMALGILGLWLPSLLLNRWRGRPRLRLERTWMDADETAIHVEGLGRIPWAHVSSLDRSNNDDGDAVLLHIRTLEHHALVVSAPAGDKSQAACGRLLERMVNLWNGPRQALQDGDDTAIYRFVPFRSWVYSAPLWTSCLVGATAAIALASAAGSALSAITVFLAVLVLVPWLVGGWYATSWQHAMPRRARVFRFCNGQLKSEDGKFVIGIEADAMVTRPHEGSPYDMEYVQAKLTNGRRIDLIPCGTDLEDFRRALGRRLQAKAAGANRLASTH
jgi:hypothetical protein